MAVSLLPCGFIVTPTTKPSCSCSSRTKRTSRNCFVTRSSVEDPPPPFSLDLSNITAFDINRNRRSSYNARRRIMQNRGVPDIHPEVFGQATKIEKLWKEWKAAYRDSFSRGLEYLTPEVIDPEDELIVANDGLWIEKKYPDIRTKSTIITKEGEVLH